VNTEIYIGWSLGSDYSGSDKLQSAEAWTHGQHQSSKIQAMRETISTEATFIRRLELQKKH
jgi:hypothetical protein